MIGTSKAARMDSHIQYLTRESHGQDTCRFLVSHGVDCDVEDSVGDQDSWKREFKCMPKQVRSRDRHCGVNAAFEREP